MDKLYTNLKKLKAKAGEVEFEAEIPLEILEKKSVEVLAAIALDFELPGFRKGKVPEDMIEKNVDKMRVFEEATDAVLYDAINEIIADEKLTIIGSPQITITKISPGNPVNFRIEMALMPKVSLPDYKKIGQTIAQKENNMEVSEAEVDEAIKNIQKMFASAGKEPGKEGEPEKLPEINDEFIKQFGPFKNIEEFRAEFKKQIGEDKKIKLKEFKRDEIIKEIIKNSKIEIPPMLIDQEFQRFIQERDKSLAEAKLSLEDYLKKAGKTKEVLEKDMRRVAEERLKTHLVVMAIQQQENIVADEKEIHEKAEHLESHYPGREHGELHNMAEAMIINEKLFALFEKQ